MEGTAPPAFFKTPLRGDSVSLNLGSVSDNEPSVEISRIPPFLGPTSIF